MIAWCEDAAGSAALRQEHLKAHLEYIETIIHRIAVAGPLQPAPGAETTGSCFIYGTEDPEEARQLLEGDPYFRAGIYRSVEWRHFFGAAGDWVGGARW
jgi:uncharacterized protein YciI